MGEALKYLIYGAGSCASSAFEFWGGSNRVECFIQTNPTRTEYMGKPVISLDESLSLSREQYIYIVASTKYEHELVENLKQRSITNWVLFYDFLPGELYNMYPVYPLCGRNFKCSFTEALSFAQIEKYKKIAIYGLDYYTQYLIAEIAYQTGSLKNIVSVVNDNNVSKQSNYNTLGISINSLEEIEPEIDCLIVARQRFESDIYDYTDYASCNYDVIGLYDVEYHMPHFHHPELAKYKGIHNGKRCFIIGNGPSLKAKDLDILHENHEICFAANMIYKIFDKTDWRPTYYCISDWLVYEGIIDYVMKNVHCKKFFIDAYNRSCSTIDPEAEYYHYIQQEYGESNPRFSEDVTKGLFWGRTYVYDIALQLAAYMGFNEIYLLGVDHSFKKGEDPFKLGNHFADNYADKEKIERSAPDVEKMDKAYFSADKYTRSRNIRIYNATRGGCLEVFERVCFDSLF